MNLDGARDSKPVSESPSSQDSERKHTKLRRFMSIGSRRGKAASISDVNTKPGSTPPLQAISPRPTVSNPETKLPKRSISTFLLSRSSAYESEPAKNGGDACKVQGHQPVVETPSLPLPLAAIEGTEKSHLPLTGDPYQSVQMQPRKDSAIKTFYEMPVVASRAAALTSHPVGKEDLEGGDKLQTPEEFWGRQKGEYPGKVDD